MKSRHREVASSERGRVAGVLTISRLRRGVLEHVGSYPNKVVMSDGYGRNLIARQIAGDSSYPLAIDSVSIGDDNTAAADAQTDLLSPLVEDIPLSNVSVTNDVVTVDVFVADANLPDDTYEEFGLFCAGRLFARVVIDPSYTKSTGEDTLFTYTLTISD